MSPDKFCLCENMQKSQVGAPQAFVWGGQSISQKEGWGVWETFKKENMDMGVSNYNLKQALKVSDS